MLGLVIYLLDLDVGKAEGHGADPRWPVPVTRDAEPLQSFQDASVAGAGQAGDLPGGEVLMRIEPFQGAPAAQAEHRRERNNTFDQRRDGGRVFAPG